MSSMRLFLMAGLLAMVAAGCVSAGGKAEKKDESKLKNASYDPPGMKKGVSNVTAPKNTTAVVVPEAPPAARVLPVNGRVASVNDELKFIIIDFASSRQPRLEQKLSVYRVGQKVGEVRVSGPYRNTTVAADIVAGEAKYGDEVRTD
jgi:hypothetical protein